MRHLLAYFKSRFANSAKTDTYFVPVDSQVNLAPAIIARREIQAASAICLASCLWIVALLLSGFAGISLPWCITLGGTALSSLVWFKTRRPLLPFSFLPIKDNRPVSFVESCAGTYLLLSLLLSGWILAHILVKAAVPKVEQQVVDIELVSPNDYLDRHQLLSGTEEKPTLAKSKVSDQVTLLSEKPSFSMRKVVSQAKTAGTAKDNNDAKEENQNSKKYLALPAVTGAQVIDPIKMAVHEQSNPALQKTVTDGRIQKSSLVELAQVVPISTFLVQDHKAVPTPSAMTKSDQMQEQKKNSKVSCAKMPAQVENKVFLEEVSPPEMMELVDNKGDQSLNIWQPGGHSTGGTGERSDLMEYLKNLNRRIKSLWSPPGNDSHMAEVLFRIRKSGQLASMKILHTSGNEDVDESIFKALTSAAPFAPLPNDYSENYLDVKYTFNYKVDGMAEVDNGATR